jgi:glutamate-1-semialdehyde 2,1-aminomutase
MGAMCEFLTRLETNAVLSLYRDLDTVWNARAQGLNERLAAAQLPVRVANLSSIWTVYYPSPSRYNWMFQYYLRAAGLSLSWVGTGRLIFSLNYTDADFVEVAERILSAAGEMQRDGWWWNAPQLTNKSIRRRVFREMVQARWTSASTGRPATSPMGSISSPRIK